MTIAYAAETLAQYRVTYEADRHHLCTVAEPRLHATGHASPQPFLPVLEETEWRPALRRVPYRPGRSRREEGHQARLFPLAGEVAAG